MQHLNYISQIDRYVEPPFSAAMQKRLVAIVAIVMLAIGLALSFSAGGIDKELQLLASTQSETQQQLKQLQQQKARLENNPELDKAIAQLQRRVDFRRRLLGSVSSENGVDAEGFAEHLSGLARQHIDGMWFTEIQLRQGGQQLALLGETKVPEYVPQYLQKLSSEPIFEGHHFRVLRMHVPKENSRVHSFELRAKDVGETE